MEEVLQAQKEAADGRNYHGYVEIRPWTRFFARLLDYIIFIWLSSVLAEEVIHMDLKGWNSLLFYQIAVFAWVFAEAALLSLFGATPGKWLLNVKVRNADGKKPGFIPALSRSIYTWLFGTIMGIPGMCIFGMLRQYSILLAQKATPWDRKRNYYISHDYLRAFKTTIVVSTYAAFLILLIIVPQMKASIEFGKEYTSKIMSAYNSMNTNPSFGASSFAASCNQDGYDLMNAGKAEEAKRKFLLGLNSSPNVSIKDSLYNNLSWACYVLKEYEEARDYSEKGLQIGDNDTLEYSNYANALFALGNISKAEEAYKKAIELDDNSSYAHYGLGQLKYENYKYVDAIEEFTKYTGLKKEDPDGWCYLGLSYLYGDKNQLKAREYLDKAMKLAPESTFVMKSMAEYFGYIDEPKEAEKIYEKALKRDPNNYDVLCEAAAYYQNSEDYEKALQYADRAINSDRTNTEAYRIKAQTFFWQGEREKAIKTMKSLTYNQPHDAEAFYTAGQLYNGQYEYRLAAEAFDSALKINPSHENAAIGKLGALYSSKHYTACLKFAEEIESSFQNKEIPWYMGDVYSRLGNPEEALKCYFKALSMDDGNISLITSIGWEYYKSGRYMQAQSYADKALVIDDSDSNAKELADAVEKRQLNIIDQVTEFIEENYMYYKSNDAYNAMKESLKTKADISADDLKHLFDTVHKKDDQFSFVLTGEDYGIYLAYQSRNTVVHVSRENDIEYIGITNFTETTANEFLDMIESMGATENKYLIIDLRGNGGGVTSSGGDILDFLLPDSVVCNLIYKDGYSSPYYSDNDMFIFKHIFVLVDEGSASCSELVTLGLKTYLDNVTIIGRNTFGKGVGQIVFEDKARGFAVFIVNHFWNVREENISDKGIKPDITIKDKVTGAFLKEVDRQIGLLGKP